MSGLPPAYIGTAEHDPLRDDGARYAELLNAAGVPAELSNEPTLVHGYVSFALVIPAAAEATDRGLAALKTGAALLGTAVAMSTTPDYHTLIVGAGFSGIGAAIKLDKAGLANYLIVEAGDGVGGTWHWNTYPGIAVDIPSFSYQFSFEQSPDWSRTYAPGRELKAYAEHCVDKYGIRSRIRFNTKVHRRRVRRRARLWRVQTDPGGEVTARFLISASGVLTVPKLPDIDGVDSFAGVTMHTARWDHSQDLTGKRVAVIGTGASAVQVIPEIAPIVKQLTVFQRTPIWCFPKFDVPLPAPARWAMRIPGGKVVQRLLSQAFVEVTFPISAQYFTVFPLAKRMESAGRAYLRQQVRRSGGARATHPAVRGRLQTARLPQRLSGHLQPRQRAAGHRADRQDHARRRWPPPTATATRSTCWCWRPASR